MISNFTYFQWYYSIRNKHALFNIGTTLFIWIFLFVARPFGIGLSNTSSEIQLSFFLLIFALTWITISYFIDFLSQILRNFNLSNRPKNGIGEFLFKILFLIHAILAIRLVLCDWSCIDLYEYVEIWFAVILLMGISYLVYTLHAKHLYYKSIIGESDDGLLVLSTSGKRQFKKPLDSIVYFKSEDNYVRIVHLDENQEMKSDLMRLTLTSAEKQLLSHSQFSRIHRSYIVNLKFLKTNIVKDSLAILARSHSITLPVSKKFKKALETKISGLVDHK